MNKIILAILLWPSYNGLAQHCGEGTLTLNIYTLNGKNIKEFIYEIIPVNKDSLEKNYFKKILGTNNYDDQKRDLVRKIRTRGVVLAKVFTKDISELREESLDDFQKRLLMSNVPEKGKFKTTIKLHTWELLYDPVIIKLSNDNNIHYLLGNFFGGCDREVSIVWLDGTQVLIGDY